MGQIDMPAYCEILQDELQRVKQENERIKEQNKSLQADLKTVVGYYLNSLKIIDKFIERGDYARASKVTLADGTRKASSKIINSG